MLIYFGVWVRGILRLEKKILMFTKISGIYNAEKRLNETVDPEILQFTAY